VLDSATTIGYWYWRSETIQSLFKYRPKWPKRLWTWGWPVQAFRTTRDSIIEQ